ncbi:MAG: hypothetical protein JNK79_13465 [Chitinophagaceae bacterium]|nr:hypothetical protein [Chitinophagaceae bacterium]
MSENKKYTAEDIRQYLEGRMSPAEMHAFEREALNDPFLADAIEGMGTYDDKAKFFTEAQQLRERLNERVRKRGRILALPILWKVAAVLLIVVTGVAIIVYTSQKNTVPNPEIAKTEKSETAWQKTDTPEASDMAHIVDDTPAKAPQAGVLSSRKQPKKEEQVPTPPPADNLSPQQSLAFEQPATVENETTSPDKMENAKAVPKALEGRAAGINIESDDKRRVEADSIDHTALDEVVIVGYGVRRSKRLLGYSTKTKNSSDIAANSLRKRIEPQGGWDAFENYLSANQNQSVIDTTKRGTEKLSFTITQNGRPSSLKILKSVSPAHDKELTRLINEGPSWQVIKGKKRKVTLSVIF